MYKLTKKAMDFIKNNPQGRMKIAGKMGVTEQAILKSIKRNGGMAIANHYDGMNQLIDVSGEGITTLRTKAIDKRKKSILA